MSTPSRRQFRFTSLNKRQVSDDVDAELAFHLARRVEELEERGLSPDDARREAASRFGNLEYTRQYCRDEDVRRERETRHTTMFDELKQDLIYATRSLRSTPGSWKFYGLPKGAPGKLGLCRGGTGER
jgi:hypothetical protein